MYVESVFYPSPINIQSNTIVAQYGVINSQYERGCNARTLSHQTMQHNQCSQYSSHNQSINQIQDASIRLCKQIIIVVAADNKPVTVWYISPTTLEYITLVHQCYGCGYSTTSNTQANTEGSCSQGSISKYKCQVNIK